MKLRNPFLRKLLRILAGLFLIWVALVLIGWITAWKPLLPRIPETRTTSVQPILNDRQYGQLIDKHPRPYVVEAEVPGGSRGAILIYGAGHTKDPSDSKLVGIEERFREFRPTVVLCEARMTGLLFPQLMDPVKTFGESGFVRQLGYESDCDVYTWEPTPEVEVRGLLEQGFSREQVALRLMLRGYFSNLRFGRPDDPEAIISESLRKKKDWPEIGNVFRNVDEIDTAWNNHFPEGLDWRDVSDEYGLPGFLGEMDANLVRDQHLFQIAMDLVKSGHRVFAITGSSHAVKLDQAVTATVAKLGN